jgi:putative membrane protein
VGDWTIDPLGLGAVSVVVAAYGLRARTLARRGTPVGARHVILFALGLLTLLVAIVTPVAALSEERFAFHMVQHLLIGDLAPLALLAGLTGPLLRPVLALPPVRAMRVLVHPFVALPLWVANLYLWHLPFAYEGALEHGAVHALEHISFFAAGVVMWAAVLETLPGPAWFGSGAKLAFIVVVRLASTLLANVFLWADTLFYDPYGDAGLSDQAAAGAVMLVEGSLITLAAFAWLFLRLFAEGERRQELLERGGDPRTVERAVRYGRADELS